MINALAHACQTHACLLIEMAHMAWLKLMTAYFAQPKYYWAAASCAWTCVTLVSSSLTPAAIVSTAQPMLRTRTV